MHNTYDQETVVAVLNDWKSGTMTTEDISKKHGVPVPTIRHWAKKAGLVKAASRYNWNEIKEEVEK